jgi:multidrug efflux pump subunit AcrB
VPDASGVASSQIPANITVHQVDDQARFIRRSLNNAVTAATCGALLALALGEGSEMLQPLAVTIVSGLLFSTLFSLVLVPIVYRLLVAR